MAIRPALRHPICLHYLRCQDFHRTWLVILLSLLWLMRHEEIDELTNCCYYLNFGEPSITLWSLSYQEIFLSTQFGHIGNGQMSFVFGYSIPDSPLFWSFECNVLWFFAWMSAVIKSIYILQEGKVCPNIPITMQQARGLCDKNNCHVYPATSGKKRCFIGIILQCIISQIDPIQPFL